MSKTEKILQMLADGKINVEQADKLLSAIDNTAGSKGQKPASTNQNGKLIIDIQSADGDDVKVNVPLKLIGLVDSIIPKAVSSDLAKEGIDIAKVLSGLSDFEDMDGDLVNINSANGDTVRIFVQK
ncbi:MAG: hypothetical protein HYV97_10910 [Bdellovibrio sp.]|nr:hypothetical protein [Bdellovibrio sp.]